MTALALSAGHASLEAHRAGTAVDAGGLLPDLQRNNSWTQKVEEVDPLELLEVQLCNSTAPFILVSRLRPAMRAAVAAGARRAYVVNVSAMEGQFSRRYKGPGHPHTNMAKAALNMMTRTSAGEMFETDRILMTAVDTGWITDERPARREAAHRGRGLARPARPRRRGGPRLRPDRARRGRRGPLRLLRQGLRAQPLVTSRAAAADAWPALVAGTRPRIGTSSGRMHRDSADRGPGYAVRPRRSVRS